MQMEPPYYAVIFSSQRRDKDEGYTEMAAKMETLAGAEAGFLEMESARNNDGFGITVSYWRDLESIQHWKAQVDHEVAQQMGKQKWYASYKVRIVSVERGYDFVSIEDNDD